MPTPKEFAQVTTTFLLVTIGWVFFRSETISDSFVYLSKMFFDFDIPNKLNNGVLYVLFIIFLDYSFRKDERLILTLKIRWILYLVLSILILYKFNSLNTFIYFQF